MIQVVITKEELEKALAALNEASERGFSSSLAILRLSEVGKCISDDRVKFDEKLILKDHPTDPSKDWGNVSTKHLEWYRCENGKVMEN